VVVEGCEGVEVFLQPQMMALTPNLRKAVCIVSVDLVCLLLVGTPCLLLWLVGDPFYRGFFCSDTSIRHPYRESTMPTWALILASYSIPTIVFSLVETSRLKRSSTFTWPRLARDMYAVLGIFVFGSLVNQLLTDTSKFTIGRLRPHFLAVCQPNITLDTSVCGDPSSPLYITDFTCLGDPKVEEATRLDRMKDSRLSFVSGHASLSSYSMAFCVLYLQGRMGNRAGPKDFRLVKPLIQVGCVLFAFFTCLTRISDYKHHPGDVVGGALLGVSLATLAHSFLVSRQSPPLAAATSTTSLMAVSTSRLYSREDLSVP